MSLYEDHINAMGHAAERMKQIVTAAETEKRALSPEDELALEKANADYDAHKAKADDLAGYRARIEAAEQARAALAPAIAAMREDQAITKVTTDFGPDGWFSRAVKEHDGTQYESMRTLPVGFNDVQGSEFRALQSAGGSAIPTTFMDFVTVFERTLNPMLDVARVFPTRTGNPLTFPRVTGDVVAGGSVTAEAGGITEADPTISSVNLGAFKIAHTTLYSAELDQDEVIGLDQILADAISRPIGLGWGTFFTNGTGTTQPWGFLQRAANAGTALGTANGGVSGKYVSATDLVTLQYALAAPYRNRGSFMANSIGLIRSYKDNNNQFIWTPSLVPGTPDQILGRPIYENPAMQAFGSANTAIAFGDFSRYYIRDVQPVRVDISRDYKFNSDQLALRVVTRRDGDLVDTAAVKFLVSQAI